MSTPAPYRPAGPIAAAYWHACLAELEAIKPGNVGYHGGGAGHGMQVSDFITSAAVSAGPLTRPGLTPGQRLYQSVAATRAAVGCNTNLGIVLLAAPLAAAANLPGGDLRRRLATVLDSLTVADAEQGFAAIRLAAPAGLGASRRHDVRAAVSVAVTVTLRQAMAGAADRDRIARQYTNRYADVFGPGLHALRQARAAGAKPAWSVTLLYLSFLSRFPDSHIRRKHGLAAALRVRAEARVLARQVSAAPAAGSAVAALLAYDAELKRRALNPGTSADLTVATLFAERLLKLDRRA